MADFFFEEAQKVRRYDTQAEGMREDFNLKLVEFKKLASDTAGAFVIHSMRDDHCFLDFGYSNSFIFDEINANLRNLTEKSEGDICTCHTIIATSTSNLFDTNYDEKQKLCYLNKNEYYNKIQTILFLLLELKFTLINYEKIAESETYRRISDYFNFMIDSYYE